MLVYYTENFPSFTIPIPVRIKILDVTIGASVSSKMCRRKWDKLKVDRLHLDKGWVRVARKLACRLKSKKKENCEALSNRGI
jgi:N-glycosylase/DNA lyase